MILCGVSLTVVSPPLPHDGAALPRNCFIPSAEGHTVHFQRTPGTLMWRLRQAKICLIC